MAEQTKFTIGIVVPYLRDRLGKINKELLKLNRDPVKSDRNLCYDRLVILLKSIETIIDINTFSDKKEIELFITKTNLLSIRSIIYHSQNCAENLIECKSEPSFMQPYNLIHDLNSNLDNLASLCPECKI